MYEVIWMDRFKDTIAELKTSYPRVEAPIMAVAGILQIRADEAFPFIVGREGWKVFGIEAAPGVPKLNIYFFVDEENKQALLMRAELC